MISALCWIPKGVAKGSPDNFLEDEDVGGDLGEDDMGDGESRRRLFPSTPPSIFLKICPQKDA